MPRTKSGESDGGVESGTAKLGAPKVEGTEAVSGKQAPALYFGSTKMNNNFDVVDEVAKEGGQGMAVTLFLKSDGEFIRVATNVQNPDGSGRTTGTALAGPALDSVKAGKAFFWRGADSRQALCHRL